MVKTWSTLKPFVDALPYFTAVLDSGTRIMYSNEKLSDIFPRKDGTVITGDRLGAILHCENSGGNEDMCGSSDFCPACALRRAVDECFTTGLASRKTVTINSTEDGFTALDLEATANAINIEGTVCVILTLINLHDACHKRLMERLFFHDVLNMASGMRIYLDLLGRSLQGVEKNEIHSNLVRMHENLIEEIQAHKELLAAESGDLQTQVHLIDSAEFLENTVSGFSAQAASSQVAVEISSLSENCGLQGDAVLLRRILVNMIKNGIEASLPGQKVTVGCRREDGMIVFWVHNEGTIAENVVSNVFKRAFSTKGTNRGLGTYSIKLFTEKYMHGKSWFNSSQSGGTTFFIKIPGGS